MYCNLSRDLSDEHAESDKSKWTAEIAESCSLQSFDRLAWNLRSPEIFVIPFVEFVSIVPLCTSV